jgi:hypothetical protein
MRLELLPATFAIVRLAAADAVPAWAADGDLVSITRTADELSIVCEAARVPADAVWQPGWQCLKVQGPLDFSMIGILASLAAPLATAGVSIFVISTFDTDYLLVRGEDLERAMVTLRKAGHQVVNERSAL